jgi:diguanylate cyclase (GGDEF)-like protein
MRLIVGNVHDEIETRRAAEAEARRLARHDVLTGLPNRAYLQEVIDSGPPFEVKGVLAAFCADLDQFKSVNDALGHQAGDEFLRRTADTIKAAVGERSFVARASGDEFVVLLDGESRAAVEAIAHRLIAAAKEPLALSGHRVSIGLSIGVAFADGPDSNLAVLIRNADLALYEAKRAGRRRFVTFAAEMAVGADRRRRLERELGAALAAGDVAVHYQPIHHASDRAMIGVEALARWQHPKLGAIGPVEFIAVAEETGQILVLGEHILRTALTDAAGWGDLFVSVNLSPVQFRLPDLAGQIAAILKDTRFPAERLQLEVTESVFLHDIEAARRQIEALRDLGVAMSLDDFGTGYSSLSYLRSLPFDKVKIDRSFVSGLSAGTANYAIVQCIVGLARQLDMGVTAEGVETESEAVLLRAAGCTTFQGYYFGRPMPAAEVERRFSARLISAAAG